MASEEQDETKLHLNDGGKRRNQLRVNSRLEVGGKAGGQQNDLRGRVTLNKFSDEENGRSM